MRLRGDIYWNWADPELHSLTHDETLSDGTHIDVHVRLSRTGKLDMFIGIYAADGMALYEEADDSYPRESMTRALAWGVGRARKLAADARVSPHRNASSK
ncbi:hypothetical protein [Pseudomonas sp. Q1]|uniref:hypothetical protein n=1 Tax=Pseudomonas sp. Q1 TaxID=2202823 RepID=UPI0021154C00|nr:hypothetical protein [Pseudomonas sp. Q1]NCE83481.1 hypothetical protein [Pseudomonas sp. Q1]